MSLTAIIVGMGSRGEVYGKFALDFPKRLTIVGIVEPRDERRVRFAHLFKLKPENVFDNYQILNQKIADIAIITTPDRIHVEPALMAMKSGYEVLLEKPMATTPEDCALLESVSN
ncbi:MAG: Gfo/Idh/MocA family oxidoreductase [Candidatus Heimdallarchaeota archaeon]|nr:Gfo/Idh/MocA family oxidoreductase [Candidatus Heimdallarchaeota archaeon]